MLLILTRRIVAPILGFAFFAGPAAAQSPAGQLIHAGATMQAIAQECDTYKAEQLDEVKEQLRKSAAALGVPAKQFDMLFAARYDIARNRIAMLSKEDRSELCKHMDGLASED